MKMSSINFEFKKVKGHCDGDDTSDQEIKRNIDMDKLAKRHINSMIMTPPVVPTQLMFFIKSRLCICKRY